MTMNEQITATVVSTATAIWAAISALKQNKENKESRNKFQEVTQTMIDQGVELRDVKKDLDTAKRHTEECERERKELALQVSKMEGALHTMERLATMQDKVPAPFVDFIRQVAEANAHQTSTSVKKEIDEALEPVIAMVKEIRDRPRAQQNRHGGHSG